MSRPFCHDMVLRRAAIAPQHGRETFRPRSDHSRSVSAVASMLPPCSSTQRNGMALLLVRFIPASTGEHAASCGVGAGNAGSSPRAQGTGLRRSSRWAHARARGTGRASGRPFQRGEKPVGPRPPAVSISAPFCGARLRSSWVCSGASCDGASLRCGRRLYLLSALFHWHGGLPGSDLSRSTKQPRVAHGPVLAI